MKKYHLKDSDEYPIFEVEIEKLDDIIQFVVLILSIVKLAKGF